MMFSCLPYSFIKLCQFCFYHYYYLFSFYFFLFIRVIYLITYFWGVFFVEGWGVKDRVPTQPGKREKSGN